MPRKTSACLPAGRRKQRVVLRSKHRVVLHRRMSGLLMTAGLVGLFIIAGKTVVSNTGWASGYVQRHTPTLEVKVPETLAELPLLKQVPSGHFLLWLPGAEWRLKQRWMRQYPAVAGVQFEKRFSENRVVARLEPRVPLARWEDRGIDKDGTVFTLASQNWASLPKATVPAQSSMPVLGRWLSEMSRTPDLWAQVVGVSQDSRGEMWLEMQTGTRVAWGPAEPGHAREKARCVAMVLEDAHKRLSGATTADARFFEEGRVIIKPKTAI